jgi:hypothetical protein
MIYLTSSKSQLDFMGPVIDLWINRVLSNNGALNLKAIKMILGERFLNSSGKYFLNLDISLSFFGCLLDLHVPKEMVLNINKDVFKPYLIVILEDVLLFACLGEGIHQPPHLGQQQGPFPKYLPFIIEYVDSTYWYHYFLVKMSYNFLKCHFHYVQEWDSQWFCRFMDFDAN